MVHRQGPDRLGGKELPKVKWLDVTGQDKGACLKANATAKDGKILDDSLVVNPKTKGIKNVFVYILDPEGKVPIHPKYATFPKEVVLDQPACMFTPRVIAMREGQVLVVKNSAPFLHNIRWVGDNQGDSKAIPANDKLEIKNLKAQKLPLPLECNIHGWMRGRLLVVNHPYFAITDEDGNFEIKDAPVGKHRLMIYHETIGYRVPGKDAKSGEEKTLAAPLTDLGELKMGKDPPKDE